MRKITLLSICLLTLIAAGCRTSGGGSGYGAPNWSTTQANEIRAAGERLGVPVRTDRMINISQAGSSLHTAPAANLETIPATELPRGVNVAVAYVDSAELRVPAGYYALRAFANPQGPGDVEGRVQLIGSEGRVATEIPATFHIDSMTLPAQPLTRFTDVALHSSRLVAHCNPAYETCYCCPNGWIVCVGRIYTVNPNLLTAINN